MAKLTEEAKQLIGEIHPALVATADKNGMPNVAPKGSFQVLDDEHCIFTEAGRVRTLANLRQNPQLSVIAVNAATRKGCRLWGKAEILDSGELFDAVSAKMAARGATLKHLVKMQVDEVLTF